MLGGPFCAVLSTSGFGHCMKHKWVTLFNVIMVWRESVLALMDDFYAWVDYFNLSRPGNPVGPSREESSSLAHFFVQQLREVQGGDKGTGKMRRTLTKSGAGSFFVDALFIEEKRVSHS